MTDYRLEGEPQPRCARIVARASCPCGGVKRRRSSRRLTLPALREPGHRLEGERPREPQPRCARI